MNCLYTDLHNAAVLICFDLLNLCEISWRRVIISISEADLLGWSRDTTPVAVAPSVWC